MEIYTLRANYLNTSTQAEYLKLTEGATRDIDWLMNSPFVTNNVKSPEQLMAVREELTSLLAATERVYPGMWDIFPNTEHEMKVVIHFPHVTIEDENMSHDMEDVYFVMTWSTFHYNRLSLIDVSLVKSSYSLAELNKGFVHSHTPSADVSSSGILNLRDTCLGNTPFDDSRTKLANEYEELLYESFLFTIPTFLEWESAEGVPYYEISGITEVSEIRSIRSYTLSQATLWFNMPKSNDDLTYTYINNKIELVADHKLETFLKNRIVELNDPKFRNYLVNYHGGRTTYYFNNTVSKAEMVKEKYAMMTHGGVLPYIPFRGEKKVFRITDNTKEGVSPDINLDAFSIDPRLIASYVKKTNRELYSLQIRGIAFQKPNKVRDIKKYLRQSEVSV